MVNIIEDLEYVSSDPVHLAPGDVVLVVSDGVTEAWSPDGLAFGYERALEVVRANMDKTSREIVAVLYSIVREFAAGAPQADDTTIVVIKSEPS
jgi:serine phosphatase RsbU (regulator of sigma subunit)